MKDITEPMFKEFKEYLDAELKIIEVFVNNISLDDYYRAHMKCIIDACNDNEVPFQKMEDLRKLLLCKLALATIRKIFFESIEKILSEHVDERINKLFYSNKF